MSVLFAMFPSCACACAAAASLQSRGRPARGVVRLEQQETGVTVAASPRPLCSSRSLASLALARSLPTAPHVLCIGCCSWARRAASSRFFAPKSAPLCIQRPAIQVLVAPARKLETLPTTVRPSTKLVLHVYRRSARCAHVAHAWVRRRLTLCKCNEKEIATARHAAVAP